MKFVIESRSHRTTLCSEDEKEVGGSVKVRWNKERWVVAALLQLTALLVSNASPEPAFAESAIDDVDLIILVDESESLSSSDLEAEREAVRQIVSLPILASRNIRVGVWPFSSGPESPRVLPECDLGPLDDEGRLRLTELCPPLLLRQTQDDRSNTDFARALSLAIDRLAKSVDSGRSAAIILLTDGRYDPDGNQVTDEGEQLFLDVSLEAARKDKISLWPIGFGRADQAALAQMAAAGGEFPESCGSQPEATLATSSSLPVQVTKVVAALTCTPEPEPPRQTPSEYFVHPMIDTLSVVVTGTDGLQPRVTNASGESECLDEWRQVAGQWSCLIRLDGSTAGNWKVEASQGSLALWQVSGEIAIDIENCDSRPKVVVSRADGRPINWEVDFPGDEFDWPWAEVVPENASVGSGTRTETRLSAPKFDAPVSSEDSFRVVLARRDGISQAVRASRTGSCVRRPPPPTSEVTTTALTNPPPPTTPATSSPPGEPIPDPNPPGPPWLLLAIASVLVLGVLVVAVRSARKKSRFPEGSEILQRLDRGMVMLNVDPSGRKKIGLMRTTGAGLVSETEELKEADFVFQWKTDHILWHSPTSADPEEKFIAEPGVEFRANDVTFRIDVPIEEIFEEGYDE